MNAVLKTLPKKPSRLKGVDPKAAEPSKPKILVFGEPGVGKTWVSLDFPNVYSIDTEGGADLKHYTDKLKASGGRYFGPDQGSLDFNDVINQLQALATESHPFKTVVVDSFTNLFNLEVAHEAERLGDKNAFGADKKPAIALTRRLVSWLTRLDMNVVLICHENPLWGTDAKGERSEIGVTFDGWDKLEYELHLALNIVKAGPQRRAIFRKSRLTGFPDGDTFMWSSEEFANRYGKDVIKRQTEAFELASEEQVAEIRRLLETVRMPEDWLTKLLTKANATDLPELKKEHAEATIKLLKEKLQ